MTREIRTSLLITKGKVPFEQNIAMVMCHGKLIYQFSAKAMICHKF